LEDILAIGSVLYQSSLSINVNRNFAAWLRQPNYCKVHENVVQKI